MMASPMTKICAPCNQGQLPGMDARYPIRIRTESTTSTIPANTFPESRVIMDVAYPIPDRDHDGVNDEEDKCPDQPGSPQNQGCPLVIPPAAPKPAYHGGAV